MPGGLLCPQSPGTGSRRANSICVNNNSHCQGSLLWQAAPPRPPPRADGKGLSGLAPGSRPAPSSTTFMPSLQGRDKGPFPPVPGQWDPVGQGDPLAQSSSRTGAAPSTPSPSSPSRSRKIPVTPPSAASPRAAKLGRKRNTVHGGQRPLCLPSALGMLWKLGCHLSQLPPKSLTSGILNLTEPGLSPQTLHRAFVPGGGKCLKPRPPGAQLAGCRSALEATSPIGSHSTQGQGCHQHSAQPWSCWLWEWGDGQHPQC